jgi:hypothetical protein
MKPCRRADAYWNGVCAAKVPFQIFAARNPQCIQAIPSVSLNRIEKASLKSEHDLGIVQFVRTFSVPVISSLRYTLSYWSDRQSLAMKTMSVRLSLPPTAILIPALLVNLQAGSNTWIGFLHLWFFRAIWGHSGQWLARMSPTSMISAPGRNMLRSESAGVCGEEPYNRPIFREGNT